jgi:catechol 2,3-dioxygenase-like lactoylglutathione lyase family enzyme
MTQGRLEHVNISVRDPQKTAAMLSEIFDWKIRWEGAPMAGGYTVHIGTETDYIAVYRPADPSTMAVIEEGRSHRTRGMLNHVAIVVDDLDATEAKIIAAGYETLNHGDYEPGRRFYFYDDDRIEYEVVSYS